jgi:hypothetical protein
MNVTPTDALTPPSSDLAPPAEHALATETPSTGLRVRTGVRAGYKDGEDGTMRTRP